MKINFLGIVIIVLVTLLVGGLIGYALNNVIGQKETKIVNSELKQSEQILVTNNTNTQVTNNNSLVVNNTITNEVNTNVQQVNNTVSYTITEPDTKGDLPSGSRTLNQNELDLFEAYLEAPGIFNFIYYFEYKDLSEFNLALFLKYYYDSYSASEEIAKEITGDEELIVPVNLFSKTALQEHFKKHTGKDLSIITKGNMPAYSEKYDSYYNRTSDAHNFYIDVIAGTEVDNKYIITYNMLDEYYKTPTETYEVTLNKVNGEFLFVSNVKTK